jgi:hypothetical protein
MFIGALMKEAKFRFRQHRQSAKGRNIEFRLTFEEWCDIWEKSGHWTERGKKKGQYVMSRYNDIGAYEVGNVFIQQSGENVSQARAIKGATNKGMKRGPQTLEHRLKNSIAHLGKSMPKSEEHKKKLSEINIGKKASEETKQKMRESQLKRWALKKGIL